MYGIPKDLNLDFLLGATLTQIAIGEYQIQFNFSPEGSFGVEGNWELKDKKGNVLDSSASPPFGQVQSLLGQNVKASMVAPPKSLTITFESGQALTIYDSSEQFESFTIQPGDIIV